MYSNRDFLLSSWQRCSSHVSRLWVATNSFAARFEFIATQWFFNHCVLGKSVVDASCWALARSLFASLSFGW